MNIEWEFNGITIKKCPRCGRWGNLVLKEGKGSAMKLAVKHE